MVTVDHVGYKRLHHLQVSSTDVGQCKHATMAASIMNRCWPVQTCNNGCKYHEQMLASANMQQTPSSPASIINRCWPVQTCNNGCKHHEQMLASANMQQTPSSPASIINRCWPVQTCNNGCTDNSANTRFANSKRRIILSEHKYRDLLYQICQLL